MAITNINTLQKLAYTGTGKDLQTYGDIYLKQSLSNLGQRFSVKGDGLTNGMFSIYEMFDGLPIPTAEDFHKGGKLYSAYMEGVVKPNDDEYNVTLTAYNVGDIASKTIDLNANNYVVLNEDLYIEYTRAHDAATADDKGITQGKEICYYGKDGIITVNNDNYCVMLSTLDKDKNILGIIIDKYDVTNNRLIEGVHIYELTDGLNVEHTVYDGIIDGKHQYTYNIYNPLAKTLSEIYDSLLDEMTSVVMTNKSAWEPNDVIRSLELDKTGDAKYGFDVDKTIDDYLTFANVAGAQITPWDKSTYVWNVLEWNETIAYVLPKFKEYYSKNQYFSSDDNIKLKRRIIAETFIALYKNFVAESNADNASGSEFTIYIPYEYEFIYTCNSNNTPQIFSSKRDIVVESVTDPTEELYKICKTDTKVRQQLFICPSWNDATSTEDIFSVWEYSVTYDDDNNVKDINVSRNFVLPYINDDGYWNINNVDTSVYARGKDGGQPSLIISYSDTSIGKHEILSTMNRDELSTALNWSAVNYRVRPMGGIIGDDSYHELSTYMPVDISTSYLSENLVTFLENAIIMSIGSVHGEVSYSGVNAPLCDPTQLGGNATVTTFWALKKDKETNEYNFSYVLQPDTAWSLDFNYLGDTEAITKYYMKTGIEPDKYEHDWLVYSKVASSLKNVGDVIYSYPVLMNRDQEYFADIFPTVITTQDAAYNASRYSNEANFVPSFVTNVSKSGSYIVGVDGTNERKYFHFDNNGLYNYVPTVQTLSSYESQTFYDEWYPNTHTKNTSGWADTLLPVMDLKEMFVRDINTLNRYNVLSTDADGKMYYAYYGTSFDDKDKSVLKLGTGVEDINLGLKTLTTEEERKKFNKHREISIEFDDITLNGRTSTPTTVWSNTKVSDTVTVYSTLYTPVYYNVNDWPTLSNVGKGYEYDIFNVEEIVSPEVLIREGEIVPKHSAYISYLNINRMLRDKLGIDNIENVTGDNVYKEGTRHYLKLTSYINDSNSQIFSDNHGKFGTVLNPLAISYYMFDETHNIVNIREITSPSSTPYTLYDGGAL